MKKKIFASILGAALSLQAFSIDVNAIDEQVKFAQNDIVVSIKGDVNSDGEFNIDDVVVKLLLFGGELSYERIFIHISGS